MKSKVLVISGVTASGKTTLINQLSKLYSSSKVISFDDYDIDQLPNAPELTLPLKDAINQYDISELMRDFRKIYNNVPLILLDFPFGYCHKVLKPYINWVVYIKTPLDVAFARQIIRDDQNKTAAEIIAWAKIYLSKARPLYVDNQEYIAKSADLVLDGMHSLEKEISEVKQLIE
ncbi:adenylylsulfate kinase [Lactobacillus sp. ESL0701]|uniref:adenylylsulfate kinase n=1 Tax=Lactobacillus sp. ESL0701 TaxID=2983217 RepID=UPI0023F84E45|nr:adenylylsulfate kinase [Lactobacillus sp. ESL0701]MDF7671716.1 adenylylsulfate kinase [Lactobacillus sp. ESL0701]